MSKFDRSPWQEKLIEATFDVVKINKRLPASLIDDVVIFRLGQRFSTQDRKLIKQRLGWSRILLSYTGYIEREPSTRIWRLAAGGESVRAVLGSEVIATRSAMRQHLYADERINN